MLPWLCWSRPWATKLTSPLDRLDHGDLGCVLVHDVFSAYANSGLAPTLFTELLSLLPSADGCVGLCPSLPSCAAHFRNCRHAHLNVRQSSPGCQYGLFLLSCGAHECARLQGFLSAKHWLLVLDHSCIQYVLISAPTS